MDADAKDKKDDLDHDAAGPKICGIRTHKHYDSTIQLLQMLSFIYL